VAVQYCEGEVGGSVLHHSVEGACFVPNVAYSQLQTANQPTTQVPRSSI